jgi:hypothetical protein
MWSRLPVETEARVKGTRTWNQRKQMSTVVGAVGVLGFGLVPQLGVLQQKRHRVDLAERL